MSLLAQRSFASNRREIGEPPRIKPATRPKAPAEQERPRMAEPNSESLFVVAPHLWGPKSPHCQVGSITARPPSNDDPHQQEDEPGATREGWELT